MVERLEWTDCHTHVSYFQVISNVCHFVSPTALKLDCITNFDMGFISLGDEYKCVQLAIRSITGAGTSSYPQMSHHVMNSYIY